MLQRKRELEKTRTVRKSPRAQDIKKYYKELSSEEEPRKKPKMMSPKKENKEKLKSPKAKKVV